MAKPISLILFAMIVLGTQGSSLDFLSSAYAYGRVPILKDENGFYVEMDYVRHAGQSQSPMLKFMISLVHYETFIANANCLGFTAYGCYSHKCEIPKPMIEEVYTHMYFEARTKGLNTDTILDSEWSLNSNALLADTSRCSSKVSNSIGAGRTGIIGLSPKYNSDQNYPHYSSSDLLFSIYINKDLSGGLLTFSKNESIIESSGSPITLYASFTPWKTGEAYTGFRFPNGGLWILGSLMFDIHGDAIAIPEEVYSYVISSFKEYGVKCSDSLNKPECQYSGKISDLPTITLSHGDNKFSIPPSIYLQDPATSGQSKLTLNFKSVDKYSQGKDYIDARYKNAIILDARFLSHYYAVFYKDRVVLYGPKETSIWLYVLIAVVIIIVALAIYIKTRKSKSKENENASSFIQNNSAPQYSVQAPQYSVQQPYYAKQNPFSQ